MNTKPSEQQAESSGHIHHERPEWIRSAAKSVAAFYIANATAKKGKEALESSNAKIKEDLQSAEHKIADIIHHHFSVKK